jgi:NTP pyrophosphatase (non-canonical NTP hydrolase)
MTTKTDVNLIAADMVEVVIRARSKYPAFNSPHEGYAVLLEEVTELQAEVFKKKEHRDMKNMRKEAEQIGAMAIIFIQDCCE